jgi:hypothetical protein
MKAGLSLQQLAAELDRQNEAKRDFLVDTREMALLPGTAQIDGEDGGTVYTPPELYLPDGTGEFELDGRIVRRQVGDHLGMPAKYWDMLEADHRGLLAHSVSTLFREKPGRQMVRCMDYGDGTPTARAFLSDMYLRRDNAEVAAAALSVLADIPDVHVPTAEITHNHLYITALAPRVQGEVKKGDVVQAGLRITNSEIGVGALKVEPILYRLWCSNGCGTWERSRVYRFRHVGGRADMNEETVRVLSAQTEKKADDLFFSQLADVMRAAVDETTFNAALVQMQLAASSEPMKVPVKAMEELGKKFSVSESEGEGILNHLIQGGDLTAYGALNAYTRHAQDVESYDRSMELEAIGGQILGMAGTREWAAIASVS